MNIVLHDLNNHLTFAPLTLTRPVGNLRTGMFTNDERCKMYFPDVEVGYETQNYLASKFKNVAYSTSTIHIDATVILTQDLALLLADLKEGEEISYNHKVIAAKSSADSLGKESKQENTLNTVLQLNYRWDIFQKNAEILKSDFNYYTRHKQSSPLSPTNTIIGDQAQIFLEKGAKVEACILNTTGGPIYLDKDAEIMEGSVVRGGLAMAESSALKLATKVYGATSLGPYCKVGGEVNNVVFQAYSNKGHDGFLGNSVIGEWCNLGADTNCSNLKNNYGLVSAYSYLSKQIEKTEVQFMGLVMGDHSKSAINTMFNTATVTGVCANIFGSGFPSKYVPSFTWGGIEKSVPFKLEKAFEVAQNMMGRRKIELTQLDKDILQFIADNYGLK
jgi:UDP-N-acetylglucosamine diphosphorylase/glucosamine-1-phosphate N-acetyltransferase